MLIASVMALLLAAPVSGQSIGGGGLIPGPPGPPGVSPDVTAINSRIDQAAAAAATAQAAANAIPVALLPGGPYTVQDGGSNPLSSAVVTMAKAGTFVGISDLGGCGANGAPGFGFGIWTGTEMRRVSRCNQATMDPVAAITLDYWKSPMRIKLTGTTAVTTTFTIVNAKTGGLWSIYKPGLISTLVTAFNVAVQGQAGSLPVLGPSLGLIEWDGTAAYAVQTN